MGPYSQTGGTNGASNLRGLAERVNTIDAGLAANATNGRID